MALTNLTKVQTVGIGSNIEVVGVVTTGQFKSGTSNLHSTGVELTNLNVSGIATIGGNISIGGTLTYQDVTNVDSVGIITARAGVNVSGGQLDVGSNIKLGNAGVITATSFVGSGANLTGITQTTINNNADNRLITGSGTANTLNGEANLTMGNNLQFNTTANGNAVILKSTGNYYNKLSFDSGNTSAGGELAYVDFSWDGDKVADIQALAGSDTTNKDDGHLVFRTSPQQGNIGESLRITSGGQLNIGGDYTQTSYNLSVTNTGGNLFRLKTANEGDFDLRFMIQNSEANIWHYGTDDLTFGARYDRKVSLIQNGSKRLTINGDLIGINNTSPAKNLHVTSSGVATLRIETTDSRGQAWDLLSTNGAGSNTGTLSFRDESGSAYLEFGANGGSPELTVRNGGANDLLHIDNNGNVTKPKQAFISLYLQATDVGGTSNRAGNDTTLVPTGVRTNVGSHYNSSNGRFTCPVAGLYEVSFSSNIAINQISGGAVSMQGHKNGSVAQWFYSSKEDHGTWWFQSWNHIIDCNANDYLTVVNKYGNFAVDSSIHWNYFSFRLVQ